MMAVENAVEHGVPKSPIGVHLGQDLTTVTTIAYDSYQFNPQSWAIPWQIPQITWCSKGAS